MITQDKVDGIIIFIMLSSIATTELLMHPLIGYLEVGTMELLNGKN